MEHLVEYFGKLFPALFLISGLTFGFALRYRLTLIYNLRTWIREYITHGKTLSDKLGEIDVTLRFPSPTNHLIRLPSLEEYPELKDSRKIEKAYIELRNINRIILFSFLGMLLVVATMFLVYGLLNDK